MIKYNELHITGENQRLEFKESFGRETVETVAAFCNASGGTVLIGVDKNGIIKGVTVTEEMLKEWVNAIKQATQPQIFPEISPVNINGKTVVAVKVQEYPIKPVSCKGKYFKRVGASNHLIPVDEMVEMQLYSIKSSFDSFKVEQTLADLDMDLIVNFFGQLGNGGRITLHDDPVVNLKKIGLVKDGQLTFAALLLFGEHQTNIHIGRFKTNDVIIDDIMIKSPLVVAVDEAMTFIKKSISLRYDFTGELRRKETWQYPLPVIRELLLNAVIHKDYRNPTDIVIKIFDDHIQFINPGSLMGGLKPEDLLRGDYVAVHRNKLLAEAFYLRGDIEKFGTGFFRIKAELQNSPELRFTLDSVYGFTRSGLKIVSQNMVQDVAWVAMQDTTQTNSKHRVRLGDELGDNQKIILDAIRKNMRISLSQLSKKTGISQTAIENNITKLKYRGLIKRTGSAKGGYWQVVESTHEFANNKIDAAAQDTTQVNTKHEVALGNKLGDKLGNELGDRLGDKLGDNQKIMLAIIRDNTRISLSQLSKKIGISQTAIENNIAKLKKRGLIKRIGSTKGGYWQVINE